MCDLIACPASHFKKCGTLKRNVYFPISLILFLYHHIRGIYAYMLYLNLTVFFSLYLGQKNNCLVATCKQVSKKGRSGVFVFFCFVVVVFFFDTYHGLKLKR